MGSAWAFHNSYRYKFFAHRIHALKFRYLGIYRNVNRFGITPFIFIASVFHEGALLFFSSVSAYQEIKRLVWLNMFSLSSPTVIVCTYVWRWYNCFPWIHFPILRSIFLSLCVCVSLPFIPISIPAWLNAPTWTLCTNYYRCIFSFAVFCCLCERERVCTHILWMEWLFSVLVFSSHFVYSLFSHKFIISV